MAAQPDMHAWGDPDLAPLLAAAADVTTPVPVVDVQDARFLAPGDMPARIADWCAENDLAVPTDRAAWVRCIVESIAQAFADALDAAQRLTGRAIGRVHLVGEAR